jgi:hypothetical protein
MKENKQKQGLKTWKKTKGLLGMQYLIILTLISSLLLAKSTHIGCSSPPPPPHFHKLTTFIVVEFFFYGLPTLETLCNLTSSCCYKAHPPSHTHTESKNTKKSKNQANKTQDKTRKIRRK